MRAFIPIIGNQIISLLLGLVGMRLISHHVLPAVNSDYGLFLSLAQVGMLITHSGILNHATRYWQREKAEAAGGGYIRFLWRAVWRGTLLLAVLLLVICGITAAKEKNWVWMLVFPFLFLGNVGLTFNGVGTGVLNADGKPWRFLVLNLVGTVARVILPIALLVTLVGNLNVSQNGIAAPPANGEPLQRSAVHASSFLALSAGYAGHGLVIVGMCIALFHWARRSSPASEAKWQAWTRELREYGRPFMFLGIGTWLTLNIDRWIAAQFFDKDRSGYFNFALLLGAIIPQMTVTAMIQFFFPSIFRESDRAKNPADWRRIAARCDALTVAFVVLSVAGLAVLHFAAPRLPEFLLSSKYALALPMIIPAGLVMVNSQVNQFHYLLLQGQHDSAGMVWVMLTTSAIKSIGGIAAAAISWEAFIAWLVLAPVVGAAVGRTLILKMTFRRAREGAVSDAGGLRREPDAIRGDDDTR
jgi:O-antigen/teichoic acid export membrane protein